jgi:hypothetical protein
MVRLMRNVACMKVGRYKSSDFASVALVAASYQATTNRLHCVAYLEL